MKKILVIVLIMFFSSIIFAAQLRECPNKKCGKAVLSNTWIYCPYCGTKLPAVKKDDTNEKGESIVGNIYKNYDENFTVERPDTQWKFFTKKTGIDKYNESATVLFHLNSEYFFMIISENMPDATLENYLELVRPSVDNRITVYEKKVTYNGLKGISVKYAGEISQIPIIYYQTILENNGTKYQILTWCAKSSDGQDLQTWLEFVYNSFKTLK